MRIIEMTLDKVPMMYRAQVQGRCSLQYGNDQTHLDRWTKEWINPDRNNNNTPKYQHQEPKLGLDGSIYRVKIKFAWRVFSNCGQDSILRPVIGKNGIPLIPGSSIKGIFSRLRNNPEITAEDKQKIESYCGSPDTNGRLRFHHAYPIGDWANGHKIVDICHPQQPKQVEGKGGPQAIALISLFEPTLVFELSSITTLTEAEWENIEALLRTALKQGIGGKTSSGYGFYTEPQNNYPIKVNLHGKGVSSVLRSGEPEFRQNLFKAVLQGHVRRLLGGVTFDKQQIQAKINHLFGHTGNTGVLQYYWQPQPESYVTSSFGNEKTPIYEIKGDLYVDIKKVNNPNYEQDLKFIQKVLEFALIMGGLGKSWRRVWHQEFMNFYKKRAIGCHWVYDFSLPKNNVKKINNPEDLKQFLTNLANQTQTYLGIDKRSLINTWRESWHPKNVKVYTKVVSKSELIELFHETDFKSIPAVGGKQPDKYNKTKTKFVVSCVWHRMLPIGNDQYLEIMTIFEGNDLNLWDKKKESFESEITRKGFQLLRI
jgi:CRISPR-associated protein Cmr6